MIKKELKDNLKSFIIWTSILILMYLMVFLIYPSIMNSENSAMLNEMLSAFPEEVLRMFNMDISGIDSVFSWFKTEGLTFLILIGSVYSSMIGISILSKEESDKTIEFLYSKPVTRNKIITSKIISGLIYVIGMIVVVTLFNLLGMYLSDDIEIKKFMLLSITPLFTMISFFFVSMLLAVLIKRPKKIIGYSLGLVFISYFLQIIGNLNDKSEFLKYLSIFELTPARDIIVNNSFNIMYPLISIIISLVSASLIYILYNKKELV